MSQHKFWCARAWALPTPATLELSEFQLFSGATRVDASATLTSNVAPNSGTLASLKDDNLGTAPYWSSGGAGVLLLWEFAAPTEVNAIQLGARTTSSRFPTSVVLLGGDRTPESGSDVVYTTALAFGTLRFVSGAKTALIAAGLFPPLSTPLRRTVIDHINPGGIGRIPYEVTTEVLPRTDPKTYVPQWAKVRLERDIDGKVIREAWSDRVTGKGVFENIDENYTYTVTAIYPDGGKRAVIADRIKPEGYPAIEAP